MDNLPTEAWSTVQGVRKAVPCGMARCSFAVKMGERDGIKKGLIRALKVAKIYSDSVHPKVIEYINKELKKLENS